MRKRDISWIILAVFAVAVILALIVFVYRKTQAPGPGEEKLAEPRFTDPEVQKALTASSPEARLELRALDPEILKNFTVTK